VAIIVVGSTKSPWAECSQKAGYGRSYFVGEPSRDVIRKVSCSRKAEPPRVILKAHLMSPFSEVRVVIR
jgi:hypothetical protein